MYSHKTINKALEEFKVNTVLDQLEESAQASKTRSALKKSIEKQMLSLVTVENIERAFQLTRKADINPQIVDLLGRDIEELDEEARLELEMMIIMASEAGRQAALDRLDIEDDKGKPSILGATGDIVGAILLAVTATSLNLLSRKVEESKNDLLTPDEAVDFIRGKIPDIAENRARLIVDQEIANATNRAEFEVFRGAGVRTLIWNTVMDERVCPICSPMDNQERTTGTQFIGGDGSSVEHPPIHVRCRCFLTPK